MQDNEVNKIAPTYRVLSLNTKPEVKKEIMFTVNIYFSVSKKLIVLLRLLHSVKIIFQKVSLCGNGRK